MKVGAEVGPASLPVGDGTVGSGERARSQLRHLRHPSISQRLRIFRFTLPYLSGKRRCENERELHAWVGC